MYIPGWTKSILGLIWSEERAITKNEILQELREATDIPGVAPTWLQPIQTRVIMLQSGMRAMMGAKIYASTVSADDANSEVLGINDVTSSLVDDASASASQQQHR